MLFKAGAKAGAMVHKAEAMVAKAVRPQSLEIHTSGKAWQLGSVHARSPSQPSCHAGQLVSDIDALVFSRSRSSGTRHRSS